MVEQTRMSVLLIVQDSLYVGLMTNIYYSLLVITPTENRNTMCKGRTDKNVCYTNRVRFVVCWSYDQHTLLSVGDNAKRDQQRTEFITGLWQILILVKLWQNANASRSFVDAATIWR